MHFQMQDCRIRVLLRGEICNTTEREFIRKILTYNMLAYGILACLVLAGGVDIPYMIIRISWILLLGIPYFFLVLGLMKAKSKWPQLALTYCCFLFNAFVALSFGLYFRGVIPLLMEIYALVIVFICLVYYWFGNPD